MQTDAITQSNCMQPVIRCNKPSDREEELHLELW